MAKEIEFQVKSYIDPSGRPRLLILGEEFLAQEVAVAYKSYKAAVVLDAAVFQQRKLFRSNPQLGYLYGHLAKVAFSYLRDDCGWMVNSKEEAIEKLKPELGFTRVYLNELTGETVEVVLSLATADREDVADFVQKLFQFLIASGCRVMSPDEYKTNRYE